jgi:hypothetical protein
VVTKSVGFIAGFINQVWRAKRPTLAALFINEPDKVDQVLKKIKYDDSDLIYLTDHRPELAESHGEFFKVIGKIRDPEDQARAVRGGVANLFDAKKHDSVIHLINALGKRKFNGRPLKNVAIQQAFYRGASRGINNIVERLHEHPAITHEGYANGLKVSCENDKLKTFPFLLSQADLGDLEKVKDYDKYKNDSEFCKAIDDATKTAPLAGTRHRRFFERIKGTKLVIVTLSDVMITGVWVQEPGSIIASYLLGEEEGINVMKEIRQESTQQDSMCCTM